MTQPAVRPVEIARRGRRRRNASGGARVHRVEVKMTTEERQLVGAMAEVQGITVPALLMRATVTGGSEAAAKFDRLRDELRAARRLLAAVSGNVNQIARAANVAALDPSAPAVSQDQLAATLRALSVVIERVDVVTGATILPASDGTAAGEDR